MREIMKHRPGRIFLAIIVLSVLGMLAAIGCGLMERVILVAGWVTMPLLAGIIFTLVWLVAYLVYFFIYWPYR